MISKALLELNAYVSTLKHYRKSDSEIYHDVCIAQWRFCYGMFLVKCLEQIVMILNKATKGSASELYDEGFLLKYAEHYFKERVSYPITSKVIVEDFLESVDNVRRCSICGRLMQEGYCQDGGYRYYCSDDCLHHDFTDEEWETECENNPDSYYKKWWEDES